MIVNITGVKHSNHLEGAPQPSTFSVVNCYFIDDDEFPIHDPELPPSLQTLHKFVANDEIY